MVDSKNVLLKAFFHRYYRDLLINIYLF